MLERGALFIGIAAALIMSIGVSRPARADTLVFSCGFTASQIAEFNRARALGITAPDPGVRFNFKLDTGTRTAVVQGPPTATYAANIQGSAVRWSTEPDEDGDLASFSFNLSTNILTTVDPAGGVTLWDCAKQ